MDNLLQSHYKSMLFKWCKELNYGIDFSKITMGSGKNMWWECNNNHVFNASPKNINRGRGCPYCSNKKLLIGWNDLETKYPEIASEWHPKNNQGTMPYEVFSSSSKNAWWICKEGHEWDSSINARTNNKTKCPVCYGRRIVSGVNDFQTKYPEIASEWHPNKNSELSPETVSSGERKNKVWWICKEGHEWEETIHNRVIRKNGCKKCSGQSVNYGFNDLATLNVNLTSEWHPTKNMITPQEMKNTSIEKAWWICEEGHEWEARISSRSIGGNGCPICANRKVLQGFNDLASASSYLTSEWHPTKNSVTPYEVHLNSNVKVWWTCKEGHEWEAYIHNRAAGRGCPSCNTGGFSPAKDSTFYFIQNDNLKARKIGITNSDSQRISQWVKNGWEIIYKVESENGNHIHNLEKLLKIWIKKDNNIMPELSEKDMHGLSGWTETIPMHGLSNKEIILKINHIWLKIIT